MKNFKLVTRFLSLAIVFVMVCMMITGCGVPKESDDGKADNPGGTETGKGTDPEKDTPKGPKKLKFSIIGEPEAMDPQDGADTTSKIVRGAIYEGLLCWRDGKITPAAAESYKISDDGLTYTFKIRDNAKWWDGQDVTAQNFVDGTIRLISPDGPNGSFAFYGYFLENGEAYHKGEITDASKVGVKAVDEKTVEFKLHQPVPYFLSVNASGFFLPSRNDIVEKYGKDYVADADKIMGNGPFKLVDWKHEQSLSFEKFDQYWDKDSIKLDGVEMLIINEANTAYNMFENGELDFVTIPPELVQAHIEKGDALYYSNGSERYIEICYTSKSPAAELLRNTNFRKALSYALDRQSIVDAVCKDGSVPALRYIPPAMAACGTTWGEKYPKEYYTAHAEVDKAKEYLQKALDEVGMKLEEVPAFKILTTDNSKAKVMVEALQDVFAKNLGIKLEIGLYQSKQLWPLRSQKEFDMIYIGNVADYNDPNAYFELLANKNKVNYKNDEYNALFAKASSTVDEEERAKIMMRMEDIIMEDMPYIPIYFDKYAWLKQDYVTGISRETISDIDPNYIYADITK